MPPKSWLRPGPSLGAIPTCPEQEGEGWGEEEGLAGTGVFACDVALLGWQKGHCPRCHLLGHVRLLTTIFLTTIGGHAELMAPEIVMLFSPQLFGED